MERLSFKNRLFCKLALLSGLIAATAFADEIRTGGARVIENPTQDGNLVLRVNDGGVKTDVLTVTGSTSALAVGPSGGTQTHSINGNLRILGAGTTGLAALRIQAGTNQSILNNASQGFTRPVANNPYLYIVENVSTGHSALLFDSNGTMFLLASPGGTYTVTSNNAGTTNVTSDGTTVTIQNKTGSDANYRISMIGQ